MTKTFMIIKQCSNQLIWWDYKHCNRTSRWQYLKDHYQLIAVDLSKLNDWNADSRAIQKIGFYGMLKTNWQVSNETVLEFYKGTAKVLWIV